MFHFARHNSKLQKQAHTNYGPFLFHFSKHCARALRCSAKSDFTSLDIPSFHRRTSTASLSTIVMGRWAWSHATAQQRCSVVFFFSLRCNGYKQAKRTGYNVEPPTLRKKKKSFFFSPCVHGALSSLLSVLSAFSAKRPTRVSRTR